MTKRNPFSSISIAERRRQDQAKTRSVDRTTPPTETELLRFRLDSARAGAEILRSRKAAAILADSLDRLNRARAVLAAAERRVRVDRAHPSDSPRDLSMRLKARSDVRAAVRKLHEPD